MGVKKFIKKSVAFVAAAAMALTMVVAPVGAGATYAEGTTSDSGLNLDKSVELQSDGTYKITLKSYGTGQYSTIKDPIGTPLDIVLVLDQSGSMDDTVNGVKKIDSLKAAVTNFVTSISNNAKGFKEAKHRIAIVGYASNKTDGKSSHGTVSSGSSDKYWVNTGLFINGKLKNYAGNSDNTSLTSTDYKNSLVNVNDDNGNITSSISTAISNIATSGATRTQIGMQMANEVFSNNPIESGSNRKRIVVVFTDGEPGQSSYEKDVAGSAVNEAYKTKNTYGATVYSVGFYNNANSDVTNFMNYISSNYPGAEYKDVKHWWGTRTEFVEGTKAPNAKYYMQASNQEELSKIFNNIYTDIEKPTTSVKLDANAVTRDIITDKLNISDNTAVTAYTEDYKGSDSWQRSANQVDLTSTINKDTRTVDVTGFDYAANFVDKTKAKGQRLVVEITGLTAAQAGEGMITNVTDKSGVYANAQTENPSEIFNECSISIPSKSYVLDYGKTVTTDASDYGVNAVTIANADEPSPYNVKLQGTYGKFAINNGDLDYTPGKINWDGIDTGYVFGKQSDSKYKWEEVNFMPASSVYYEDDFGTDSNGDANVAIVWTGSWNDSKNDKDQSQTGINSKDNQQGYANKDYGWDSSYEDDTKYSNGSAHYSSQNLATATFRFTGTGVDVYSRTNSGVGMIDTVLRKVTKNADKTETVKDMRYKTIDNLAVTGDYYQIPTLTYDNLPYGTYEVTINVVTVSQEKRGIYYLDGIRVYNPLKGNQTAEDAYDKANEANAKYITVRSGLIDTTNTSVITSKMEGSVFIDKVSTPNSGENTTTDIGTYKDYGPKNEVYLKSGQGVAFTIKNYNSTTDKVAVGLKSPTGSEVTVDVTAGAKKSNPLKITSASDLYYEVTPTSDGKVVIKNTSGALLSVTKVKITSKNTATNSAPNEKSLVVTPELMSYVDTFDTLPVQEDTTDDNQGSTAGDSKDDMLDKDDVDIDNPSDNDKDNSNEDNNSEANKPNNIWNQIISSIKGWFRK